MLKIEAHVPCEMGTIKRIYTNKAIRRKNSWHLQST